MDPRLEEASHAGDLDALHRLLQQDRLLLDRLTATPIDNPLHIAALLGHADFAREILRRKHDLARELNNHGLSPMHLASATGHLSVVMELLKEEGSELCLVRDKDGLMPIHSAASKGRVHVLAELIKACPESARELTYTGDTILHLAVKSHCLEAVKLLVERIDHDEAWLNFKDDKGNTVSHLAVATRQLQTTKFLLTQPGIDVNGVNVRGLTALDVLLESPREHGDLALGEMIRASGGNTAGVGEALQPAAQMSSITVTADALTRRPSRSKWTRSLRFGHPSPHRMENSPHRQRFKAHPDDEKDNNIKETLLVVAALIATITFQAGLNPPGGFDNKGNALIGDKLRPFLIADMIGLFASLSVILLFICVVPRTSKHLTRTLLRVMWVAVYATALAFSAAANVIFPHEKSMVIILVKGWYLIVVITIVSVYIRLAVYLQGGFGWWRKKKLGDGGNNGDSRMGLTVVIKRILGVAMIVAPTLIVALLVSSSQDSLPWL